MRSKNPADSREGRGPSPAASLKTYGILLFEVLTNLSDPATGAPYQFFSLMEAKQIAQPIPQGATREP